MQNRKQMFAMIAVLGVVLFLISRSQQKAPAQTTAISESIPVGTYCLIEFCPRLSDVFPSVRMNGIVKICNDKWIVLHNDKGANEGDCWIPRENVFFVLTGKAAQK